MGTCALNSGFKRLWATSAGVVPSHRWFWAWKDPGIKFWCLKAQKQDKGKCCHIQALLGQEDEPWLCGVSCTGPEGPLQIMRIRWFWKLFNTNFQQFLVLPLGYCIQAKPFLIISSSVLISRIFMSLMSSSSLSTENWALENSWVLLLKIFCNSH